MIMDKLIMDTQRLKKELSTDRLKKSSNANGEKGLEGEDCAEYTKSILEII